MARPYGVKRSREQRERDLADMAQALRRGARQEDFAQRFGITQQQISKDLRELDRRWKATQLTGIEAQRRYQLEQLTEIKREAWRAWQASQQERVETMTERVGPPSSEGPALRQVARLSKKPPEWALAALQTILAAIKQEAELLGTEAPQQNQHLGADGRELLFRIVYGGSADTVVVPVESVTETEVLAPLVPVSASLRLVESVGGEGATAPLPCTSTTVSAAEYRAGCA